MIEFSISNHAVEQYRSRVLSCPERSRSDDDLRGVIKRQLGEYRMNRCRGALVVTCGPWRPKKKKPWEMTVNYPTHMFVIDDGTVVTTLGFMMMPKKLAGRKARIRRARLVRERVAALMQARGRLS